MVLDQRDNHSECGIQPYLPFLTHIQKCPSVVWLLPSLDGLLLPIPHIRPKIKAKNQKTTPTITTS